MATLEEARQVKALLKERLGKPDWLRGIGIGNDSAHGFVVRVNVDALTDEIRKSVPALIESVQIEIQATGEAQALRAPNKSQV